MKMIYNKPLYAMAMFAVCGYSTLPAQSEAGGDSDDDVFELSPFVVDGSDDQGYRATSTLAGTRLKTDLKDIGAAISVITEEFLEDTGSTSIEQLFVYTTNTEVGGPQGNFSNTSEDIGSGSPQQAGARSNPQGNTRIRGLVGANLARDYFRTNIGFDSYNTGRVTINRGPNSILFGMGSPGGVVNNSLKKAVHGRDFNEVSVRLGERGSHRETFDLNKSFVDGKFALRVMGLNQQEYYQQEPANEKQERFYATADWILSQNKDVSWLGKTTLSANFEAGIRHGTPMNVMPPTDVIRPWFEDTDWDTLEQYTGWSRSDVVPDAQPFVKKWTIDNVNESAPTGLTLPTIWRQLAVVYSDAAVDQASLGIPGSDLGVTMGNVPWSVTKPLPGRQFYFTRDMESNFPSFVRSVMQDPNIFDYENILISGETEVVNHDFESYTVSFEQLFLDGDAGIQMGYNYEEYEKFTTFSFDRGIWGSIVIDQAEYINNGEPNPNVGRPALLSSNLGDHGESYNERQSFRVTPFYEFDFQDKLADGWASHLGRHVFTGLYDKSRNYGINRSYAQAWSAVDFDDTVLGDNRNLNTMDILAFRRQAAGIVYVGPSLLDVENYEDVRLNEHVQISIPQDGDTFQTYYYDTPAGEFAEGTIQFNSLLNRGNSSYQEFDAEALSLQSYWLGGNLVTLYGWRKDSTKDFEDAGRDDRGPDGAWDPANLDLDMSSGQLDSGETKTWSVVGHVPSNWMDGLPLSPQLSFFYNESENFTPSGLRRDEYTNVIGPQNGETKEYGFSMDLMENKISVRLNWFETGNTNIGTWIPNGISNIRRQLSRSWVSANDEDAPLLIEDMTFADHYDSWEEVWDTLMNDVLPASTAEAVDFRLDYETGVITDNDIEGMTATTSFIAEGFELELTANPTKSFRISANVAEQTTVKYDTGATTKLFVDETIANLKANHLWDWKPEGAAYLGYGPGDYTANIIVPLATALVKDNTISEEQRRWRANLVANYSFRNGPVKGFSVGGSVRWQDKAAIGYPLYLVEQGDGSILQLPELNSPYYAPDIVNGDIWLSYRRKIFDNIDWKVQLNVRNAFGDDDLMPSRANPDGSIAYARIAPTQEFYLTNTFKF